MKYNESETMEEWSQRVILFEYGLALTRMASEKEPIEDILNEMSKNITSKLMHPVLNAIRESSKIDIEKELKESRENYQKNYLDKFSPKSDHIK